MVQTLGILRARPVNQQRPLTGTKGHVLNALQLGNELIVYKEEDSVYALNYVGGSLYL